MKLMLVVFVASLMVSSTYGFRYPMFLENASDQAKEAFVNIVTKDGLSPQEKETKIAELVKSLPQSVQTAYATFKQQQLAIKDQFGVSVQNEIDLISKA